MLAVAGEASISDIGRVDAEWARTLRRGFAGQL